MTSRKPLLPVADALAQITQAMHEMGTETLALTDAIDRVLAEDIHALVSHPPHDVSAMDGYAAASSDLAEDPTTLKVIGESAAGHPYDAPIEPQSALGFLQGLICHKGLMLLSSKDTSIDGDHVTILERLSPVVMFAGKPDFTKGDRIAEKGIRLDAGGLP